MNRKSQREISTSRFSKEWLRKIHITALVLLLVIGLATSHPGTIHAAAEGEPEVNWVEGTGQDVELEEIATLKLQPGMIFLNAEDTRTYSEYVGSRPNYQEIGSVFPIDEGWAAFFDYDEVGHIKDDEKDKIDADELLESYQLGTEEANKDLEPENHLFVIGWDVPPAYDENLNSLKWSLLAEDADGNKLINYNVRILTRQGYISAVLVSDPDHLSEDIKSFERLVLSHFTVNDGERYEQYDPSTDKLAEYGLTGLMLGGAGVAVAKKVGLIATLAIFFKKFGIIIIAGLAGLWKFLSGRKKRQEVDAEQTTAMHADPNYTAYDSNAQPADHDVSYTSDDSSNKNNSNNNHSM